MRGVDVDLLLLNLNCRGLATLFSQLISVCPIPLDLEYTVL